MRVVKDISTFNDIDALLTARHYYGIDALAPLSTVILRERGLATPSLA